MGSVIGSNASVSVEGSLPASRGDGDCFSAALADPELIRLLRRSSVSFFSSLDTPPLSATIMPKPGRTRHGRRFHRLALAPRRSGGSGLHAAAGTGSGGSGLHAAAGTG